MYTVEKVRGTQAGRTALGIIGSILISGLSVRSAHAQKFENPLFVFTIHDIVARAIYFLLGIATVLALLSLVVGGIFIIFAGLGTYNEKKVMQGKQIIAWAIAGLAIVILSWTIVGTVVRILGAWA